MRIKKKPGKNISNSLRKKEILELKKRRNIYNFISSYPGVHLREIFRKINMSEGAIKYHIDYLKNQNLIIEKSNERYSRFYIREDFEKKDKELYSFLRLETPRNIILFLLVSTYGTQLELSKELEKNPKTIEYHLKKLKEKGIIKHALVGDGVIFSEYKNQIPVERSPIGREKIYILNNPYYVYKTLITFKDEAIEKQVSTSNVINFFEFLFRDKPINKFKSNEDTINYMIDYLYDMFPPPYFT